MHIIPALSKAKISALLKLRQKKFRQQTHLVILEGKRLLSQLAEYGIQARELYISDEKDKTYIPATEVFSISSAELKRLCDSEHPPGIAALFDLPAPSRISFRTALYLDGVSDPGNLGTIFRLATAFGIDQLLLSDDCCDVGSPKVIRASLGAVYHIPFAICDHQQLIAMDAQKYYLDMHGDIVLSSFQPGKTANIFILGSEAHGISESLKQEGIPGLSIEMSSAMESLNVAISAGILCHHLFVKR
ncbi:MAG TPA: RNA methyltransferase [Candidatus Cloacimonadota bacterium]|nr:RNA methyltransferase [Candidatus Cloacimonadota bacterium]